MLEGYYAVYVSGLIGQSTLIVCLSDGVIVGADPFGGVYDGTYIKNERGDYFNANIQVIIPANSTTVQGVESGEKGLNYTIEAMFPENLQSVSFVSLSTPLGPVNARFQKIRGVSRD